MDFGTEVFAHRRTLYRRARRFGLGHEAAEDLVQDTFLAAVRNQASFDGSNLPGWLHTILFRGFLNERRSARRRIACDQMSEFDEITLGADRAVSQLDSVFLREVGELLGRVRPVYRDAFAAVAFENLTYEEAAEALDIPKNTLKTRVHRCRMAVERLVK